MKRDAARFLCLLLGFFVLYALTAQRGLGWSGSDSAEFQDWILHRSELICGPHFSNAHPFYVVFCRMVASTPTAVTLVSSFFGALAVGGFFLCTKRAGLAVLFGLSHMLWWNSALAEVQTMNLAFTAFETWLVLSALRSETHRIALLSAAALLAGLHLGVHNFALLALPAYGCVLGWSALEAFRRKSPLRAVGSVLLPLLAWGVGASFWLYAIATRGLSDVLTGAYGSRVAGVLPTNWTLTGFNLALAAMSFFVPAVLFWWSRKDAFRQMNRFVLVLFAVNFVFFIRYFVPDQATFLLPTLFFAYLLLPQFELKSNRLIALGALQLLLPVMAYTVLSSLPLPSWKTRHEGRNDAAYFALPWKICEGTR